MAEVFFPIQGMFCMISTSIGHVFLIKDIDLKGMYLVRMRVSLYGRKLCYLHAIPCGIFP